MIKPTIDFVGFPKIPRLSRGCIVTEKIDGTNAQIYISDDGKEIFAGSRSRWIIPGDDNYGFALWVETNKDELLALGPGHHFGEWWGAGIQRRYGLTEKRFSLFNVHRWNEFHKPPACCHVVPVLWRGEFNNLTPETWIRTLEATGSAAAPGFMDPEGIVVFHAASGQMFKKTVKADASPKSLVDQAGA